MCFSNRKRPACIVAIFSAVLLATSIGMIALAIKFTGADIFKALKDESGEVNRLADVTFYILASFSTMSLIMSIWGLCLLKCCKAKCCPICFGVCLLPVWVLTFMFGTLVAWFSNSSPSTVQAFCSGEKQDSAIINWGRDLVKAYDVDIGRLVDSTMCSEDCPCPDTSNKFTWLALPEDELNSLGRSALKVSTQGYTEFDFSGTGAITYRKFSDCYRDIRNGRTSRVQPEQAEFRDRWEES